MADLTPEALAAEWAQEAARVEGADPLRAAWLREHAALLGRAHAALAAERDAHKLRADHYEGLWRAEHGLPPEDDEGGVVVGWNMTSDEWAQLSAALRKHPEIPYIKRLIEAGKIPAAAREALEGGRG